MILRYGTSADLEKIYNLVFNNTAKCFTWGDDQLDVAMPLLQQGHFVVLAGSEGSGKTTWTIEMALQNARNGKNADKPFYCGYLSLEMLPHRIVALYAQRKTKIQKEDVRNNFALYIEGKKELENTFLIAAKEFIESGLCLFYNDEEDTTGLEYIEKICREPDHPDILFIDNLNEITVKGSMNEYERFDLILRELHRIKKECNVAFVLLHHLAKAKQGEPISNNNIKGNNIVVTKPDITVIIDKAEVANPNWICPRFDSNDRMIRKKDIKAFMSEAPLVELRKIEVKKDRDTDLRGVKGYLTLNDGVLKILNPYTIKEEYPLLPEDDMRYKQMLASLKAAPINSLPDTL